jgi:hypothetical protein
MLKLPVAQARAILGRLADAHLLVSDAAESYYYHDMIKKYARQRAQEVEGRERCDRVLHNLAEFDAAGGRTAVDTIDDDAPVEEAE